jgi:HD superfamily phosphohydrolase
MQPNLALERARRDEDDIGRILGGLFDESSSDPRRTFAQYVVESESGRAFGPELMKRKIDGASSNYHVLDLFPFTIEAGFRIIPGGSAIVFEVGNPLLESLRYALKVQRPSIREELTQVQDERKQLENAERKEQAEFVKHGPLSHVNIARVYTAGTVRVVQPTGDQSERDAILMEWVDEALPLNAYIVGKDFGHVVDLITQSFDAVGYLHESDLIHWDLKSDNLLVDGKKKIVKLMDVGNARRRSSFRTGDFALSTLGHLPPDPAEWAEKLLRETGRSDVDSRRAKIPLPDGTWDSPWLDLWMLARELYELFAPDNPGQSGAQTYGVLGQWSTEREGFLASSFPDDDRDAQFALRFIRLTLVRLLRPTTPSSERYYEFATEVAHDLRKLTPEFGAAQSVHELWAVPQRVMRTPVSRNVAYTKRLAALFNSTPVKRLTRHLQLGSIAHAYPGATHQRFEHAAGVLTTTCQYVRALYSDQTNPFWRASIEARDVEALLFAAAIHDMGHIACGHYLEEMTGLFRGRMHEDYAVSVLGQKPIHEVRFSKTNLDAIDADREELHKIVEESWRIKDESVAAFLNRVGNILRPSREVDYAERPESSFIKGRSEWLKTQILHSIIDSAIDADKLDYLMRDSYHCGVEYGNGIDSDRFYQALTAFPDLSALPPVREDPQAPGAAENEIPRRSRRACVGVTDKGILSVESILVARYQMFRSIYWHHTARAETAMLQFLVAEYVGNWSGDKTSLNTRLEKLIYKFRTQTDDAAFRWLKTELPEATEESEGTEHGRYDYKLFHDICDCLIGNRDYLYHQIFELRYERDDADVESFQTQGEKIYEMLEESSRKLNGDVAVTPAAFIEDVRKLRGTFSRYLSVRLGASVKFNVGDILIDIPPAGRDQVNNVFVDRDGAIRPIQNVSPLANAVRGAFKLWARHVRVFISRTALERCKIAGIKDGQLEKACWDSLRRIQGEADTQSVLFGYEEMLEFTSG